MDLTNYLTQNGFSRVALSRSGVGHFHASGELNHRRVAVLIDTGASNTIISLSIARDDQLNLQELAARGGGAGGAQLPIFHAHGAELAIGGLAMRSEALFAMDISHVNESLAMKGESAVDVILGADILSDRAAVIDYASNSLFLRVG